MEKGRNHSTYSPFFAVLVVLALFLTPFLLSNAKAVSVPHRIGYEGQLKNSSGTDLTGSYDMVFRIYTAETGGSAVFTETHTDVSVNDGYFAVSLGSSSTLDLIFDRQYWISIEVNSDGEMTPRQRLQSVGTAYSSDIAFGSYATSTPPATSTGALYYDTDDGNVYVYDHVGAAWVDLTDAGIASLGGLTTSTQYFATSTATGTFTLTSSGATHTLTLPSNVGFFANDSGYLTGNETITLTGDVSGSGTTSISVSLGADTVALSELANADFGDFTCDNASCTVDVNAVALGTDTTGNYVATIADNGSSTIVVYNSGSESAAVTIDVVDLACTDCLNTTEIEDIYVLNTGDTISGNLTVTGTLDVTGTSTFLGNVGIGTTSPAYLLDVAGTFHAQATATLDANLIFGGTTFDNLVGDGLATSSGDLIFDCSDVAGTGLSCSGEDLILSITEGTAIDFSGATVSFDSTEVATTTWGAGAGFAWTFNAGASDPTIEFASDLITLSQFFSASSTITTSTVTTLNLTSLVFDAQTLDSLTDDGTLSNISGDLRVVDVTCTDCLNATEIEDIYVLNTGDTIGGNLNVTGTLDVGATSTFLGNVSIGTTTPGANLHVQSTTGGYIRLFREDSPLGAGDILGRIEFYTDGASCVSSPCEVARIESIANTAGQGDLTFYTGDSDGAPALTEQLRIAGNGRISFFNIGTNAGNRTICWSSTGFEVTNNNGACGTSLEAHKENIEDLGLALEDLMKLRPVAFDWRKEYIGQDTNEKQIHDLGFIAEEVEEVSPLLAQYGADGKLQSVKYANLTSLIVKSIQEQQLEIDKLRGYIEVTEPEEDGGMVSMVYNAAVRARGALGRIISVPKDRLAAVSNSIISALSRSHSFIVADNSQLEFTETDGGIEITTYSLQSSRREIMISGEARFRECGDFSGDGFSDCNLPVQLSNGGGSITLLRETDAVGVVLFDETFTALLDQSVPVRVIVSPTSRISRPLYTAYKSTRGFTVRGGEAGDTFDWVITAQITDGNDEAVELRLEKNNVIDPIVTESAPASEPPDETPSGEINESTEEAATTEELPAEEGQVSGTSTDATSTQETEPSEDEATTTPPAPLPASTTTPPALTPPLAPPPADIPAS